MYAPPFARQVGSFGSLALDNFWPEATKHYMNSFGQDKVMFGTDWPVVDPERAMDDVQDIEWKPKAKRKVLRDNALNLYNL